jgi:hypothetical protein
MADLASINLEISVNDRDLIRATKAQKKFEANLLTIESALRRGKITSSQYTRRLTSSC